MGRSNSTLDRMLAYLGAAALLLGIGCRSEQQTTGQSERAKPAVFTVNYPLAYFAERIAGDFAVITFPAPHDVDPDFWQPDEKIIEQFQNADLILLNGANYASWTETVSLPEARTVNTSEIFQDMYITLADAVVHKHGPEGEHAHEGLATLTWLDPQQARQQAEVVYERLLRLLPDREDQLKKNWSGLDEQLREIEQHLKELPKPADGKMLASHPVYDYLARFCGWDLKSMHWEPHETPSDEQWKGFDELQQNHAATIMLWEAPPTEETQARLESAGVTCVPFYTCGNRPESGDYVSVMNENVQRLKAALEEKTN